MGIKSIRRITSVAILLALFVIMLGAYTRLTDAGLGCPDWPGCYGHMVLPSAESKLLSAQSHFPEIPIEGRKAWTEMAHRYAAGTLALLIVVIFINALVNRRKNIYPTTIPVFLALLVVCQAMLGMWTVTLKLLPVVVMAHLLGGVLIFVSLCYLRLQLHASASRPYPAWRFLIILGVIIVFVQIALGGWVSSNYAGIACIGFPRCNGNWLPALHFSQGFNLFSPVGANYQGGVLDNDIRVTIQFIHRLWAVVTAVYVLILSLFILLRLKNSLLRRSAIWAILLVIAQFVLGVVNVQYLLPLWSAVAHNGVAALLLATMVTMIYLARGDADYADE